jgi:hypothetical protein
VTNVNRDRLVAAMRACLGSVLTDTAFPDTRV